MALKSRPSIATVLQVGRFGIVGVAATLTHVAALTLFVELGLLFPKAANIVAFFPAFALSYHFHNKWTFRCSNEQKISLKVLRFFTLSVCGLAINSLGVYLVVDVTHLEYYYSFPIILFFTPLFVFVVSKKYVFVDY